MTMRLTSNQSHHQITDIIFIIFIIILIIILGSIVADTLTTVHFGGSRDQNRTALGELTKGVVVQQEVPVRGIRHADTLCYDVLFATYRRLNSSTLQISLIQNNYRQSIKVDSSKFKDNHIFPLCFRASGFSDGKAILEINGLNGKPGQSPTVGLTSDISYGRAVHNGYQIEKSLIFKAHIKRNFDFFFALVGALLIPIIIFSSKSFVRIPFLNIITIDQFATLKKNKLLKYFRTLIDYQFLIFIFSVIALTLSFVMATISWLAAHPDEKLHSVAATYYESHNLPPIVGDPEANFTYTPTRYGISYINQSGIDYFLIGKFSSFIKSTFPLKIKSFYNQRYFNLFLFLVLCLIIWRSKDRLIYFPIVITPQVWYIASYINNDFFPFFVMMVLCFEFLDNRSFYNRSLTNKHSIGFIFPAGVFLGILLISKLNYIVFVIFSVYYLIWNALKLNQFKFNRSLFLSQPFKSFLLILICAISVYAIRIGFDIYQNGINKNEKLEHYANQFAAKGFRPIDIETDIQKTPSGLRLREKGKSLENLIMELHWYKSSINSFFGVYGWMNIKAPELYYQWIIIFAYLLVTYAGIQSILTFQINHIIFLAISYCLICMMVAASLYHSWTYDFQPQGRYLFPILGILSILFHETREYLNRYILSLLISLMFTFSFWSFLFIGIYYYIDKLA